MDDVEECDLERRGGPPIDDRCDPTREQSTTYPDSTGTPGGVSVQSISVASDQSLIPARRTALASPLYAVVKLAALGSGFSVPT